MNNLEKINGNEIIDYLNTINDIWDMSIVTGSFIFDYQILKDNKYTLYFTAGHNNWGTNQEINDNYLRITKDELWFGLNEPFEGDGTADSLEKALKFWLKTHKFNANLTSDFNRLIENAYYDLNHISYNDGEKLDEVIKKLIKAKTYIK